MSVFDVAIGDWFTNSWELTMDEEDIIEILDVFVDHEDGNTFYIAKSRGTSLKNTGWYYEDEVVLLDAGFLYKYFERAEI